MVQETHSTDLVEQKWWNQWHGKMFYSHGTSYSTGVLICITEDLAYMIKIMDFYYLMLRFRVNIMLLLITTVIMINMDNLKPFQFQKISWTKLISSLIQRLF